MKILLLGSGGREHALQKARNARSYTLHLAMQAPATVERISP